jgi:hypothetical protein
MLGRGLGSGSALCGLSVSPATSAMVLTEEDLKLTKRSGYHVRLSLALVLFRCLPCFCHVSYLYCRLLLLT